MSLAQKPSIRTFNHAETEYAALSALQGTIWPDRDTSVAALRQSDRAHDPNFFFQRFVAEVDQQVVAACSCTEPTWLYRPGKYAVSIEVAKHYQGQGIGALLYRHLDALLQARTPKPTIFTAATREDQGAAMRFLEKQGYRMVMRSPTSRLNLTTFNGQPFSAAFDKVRSHQITLYTGSELAQLDPAWAEKVYELDWECTQDEPLPDMPTKPSFAEYVATMFDPSNFLPEAMVVAVDQGQDKYVGITCLYRNRSNPAWLGTGFTGVLKSHRRMGIASALKVRSLQIVQQQGYQMIRTGNEENNPMYALNLALGFQPEPAWLDYQKTL